MSLIPQIRTPISLLDVYLFMFHCFSSRYLQTQRFSSIESLEKPEMLMQASNQENEDSDEVPPAARATPQVPCLAQVPTSSRVPGAAQDRSWLLHLHHQ